MISESGTPGALLIKEQGSFAVGGKVRRDFVHGYDQNPRL